MEVDSPGRGRQRRVGAGLGPSGAGAVSGPPQDALYPASSFSGFTSPVSDDILGAISYALQAAPNPFNSLSRVSFELQRGGDVKLDLYNLRSEQVIEVFHGYPAAGVHVKTLDGAKLASGAYVL